jgi:hypothetical protein
MNSTERNETPPIDFDARFSALPPLMDKALRIDGRPQERVQLPGDDAAAESSNRLA